MENGLGEGGREWGGRVVVRGAALRHGARRKSKKTSHIAAEDVKRSVILAPR